MDIKPFEKISEYIRSKLGRDISEKVYLILLCIFILLYNASLSVFYDLTKVSPSLPGILSLLRKIVLMLLILNSTLVYGKHTVKEYLIYAVCTILLYPGYRTAADNNLILSMLIIYSSKGFDIRKIAKVYLYTYITVSMIIFSLFFTRTISEVIMYRCNGVIKHSLGFDHPNSLGRVCFVIQSALSLSMPMKSRKNKVFFLLVSAGLIIFSYIVPNCRAVVVSIGVLAVLVMISWTSFGNTSLFRSICLLSPAGCAAFSILTAVFFDESSRTLSMINNLSTGRIQQAYLILQKAGWGGLFGNNVYWTGYLMDNCYYMLFLCFGLLSFVVFLFGYYLAMKRAVSCSNTVLLLCLTAFAVFGIFEMHTYYIMFNLALTGASARLTAEPEDSDKLIIQNC